MSKESMIICGYCSRSKEQAPHATFFQANNTRGDVVCSDCVMQIHAEYVVETAVTKATKAKDAEIQALQLKVKILESQSEQLDRALRNVRAAVETLSFPGRVVGVHDTRGLFSPLESSDAETNGSE